MRWVIAANWPAPACPRCPAGVLEQRRLVIRFGEAATAEDLMKAADAASEMMARVGRLL